MTGSQTFPPFGLNYLLGGPIIAIFGFTTTGGSVSIPCFVPEDPCAVFLK